jgi:glycosyltransferase involved in cell wall biosynthesis
MRICIVAFVVPQHSIGGMQDHTRDLGRGLVRAGHEVVVITSAHPNGKREECVDGVRYVFVDAPRHQNHPVWLRESYAGFLRLHSERPFELLHSESSSAVEHLRRGVHHSVPTVAMFHGAFLGAAKGYLRSALRTRRPVPLLRAARRIEWIARHEYLRHGNWYRFRPCEAIVPSIQQVKDTCRSCLLKPSRVHVVPNGIDTRVFSPRPREEMRGTLGVGDLPLFVCAGRLEQGKGTHHAVRALALLASSGYPGRLVIFGDGPERTKLEHLAKDLGLAQSVVFKGPQPHDVLAEHLAAADAFVFPTELDEAAPLAPVQALACGTPVIASGVGSVQELIDRSGENGLLVRPGEPEALAAAMRCVLTDADLRQRLCLGGQARVRAEYTLERMVERTLAVYDLARQRLAANSESR